MVKYTETMIKDIKQMRNDGYSWSDIADEVSDVWNIDVSAESVRCAYKRAGGKGMKRIKQDKPPKRIPEPTEAELHRELDSNNERILFISDMHIPYHHPDTFAFLAAVKKKYRPTRIVCVGDEVDKHAMSFHDSDPDLFSAGHELQEAICYIKELGAIFPKMDLVSSNHGDMVYRKGKHHGIPRKYLRDYGEVLEAPKGWTWSHDLTLTLPDGNELYVHHGLAKNAIKVVTQRGTCFVQGHYHTEATIQYAGNPNSLLWGMTVGCSIDKSSLAFAYDRTNLGRPIISHAITIDGHPRLLPMVLSADGRWTGVVP